AEALAKGPNTRFVVTTRSDDPLTVYDWYVDRGEPEVTFHDSKQHLGFGQVQNQTRRAVTRTAPFAGVVYSLVLLWAAAHLEQGGSLSWIVRPWYRTKTAVAFPDLLMALRQELWTSRFSQPPIRARRPQNPAPLLRHSQQ